MLDFLLHEIEWKYVFTVKNAEKINPQDNSAPKTFLKITVWTVVQTLC